MRCLLSGFLFVLAVTAHAAEFLPFRGDSRAAIEQAHAGQAMILTFWSVDCAYCVDDLALLGEVVRRHPQIVLVTVNTDDDAGAVNMVNAGKVLDKAGLPAHARWRFATQDSDRLRYQIDRKWYGELPRSYFYDKQHRVKAVSGKPAAEWLEGWLQELQAAQP
jgi:thiol-disulfide isomerase/thioredoxin